MISRPHRWFKGPGPFNKGHGPFKKKLELLVIRTDRLGNLKNSKPCNHCLQILMLFGVKTVYYSTDEGDIVKEIVKNVKHEHYSSRQNNYYKNSKKSL